MYKRLNKIINRYLFLKILDYSQQHWGNAVELMNWSPKSLDLGVHKTNKYIYEVNQLESQLESQPDELENLI